MKIKHSLTRITFALLLLLINLVSYGQSIEGEWSGVVKVQDKDLRMNLYISHEGQAYTSTYDSPDQGTFGKQSTKTTFSFPDFSFSNEASHFEVRGKVDSTYQSIHGQMFQNDRVFSVELHRKTAAPSSGSTAKVSDR